MAGLGMASEVHHIIELPEIGTLNVFVQGNLASRSVAFVTVHDLGCNHYQYEDFVSHPKMRPITERSVWINVDLPGQGEGEEELPASYTFPTIQKIAENLKAILDHFNITHAVLFGEGAGANILARFAMLHDEMVLGAVLIHCTGQTASFADSLRDKLVNWKLNTTGMNAATESFLILHRFGWITDTGTELELRQAIEHFRENLHHSINPKNLNRYINAYMHMLPTSVTFLFDALFGNLQVDLDVVFGGVPSFTRIIIHRLKISQHRRKTLIDRLRELRCSVLLITGALAPQRKGCEKLYECLQKAQKENIGSNALREMVVIEDVANVLVERPDKVIESMQYFLQGIGLVSHVKMQTTPLSLNRRMSMEDYDRPVGRVQLAAGFRPNLSTNDVTEGNE